MANSLDYKRSAILFVDDEEKSLKYFAKIFSNVFRIVTTTDPDEALVILENQADDIGVLITDQRMPKQTGVDLLKYTRKNHPEIVRMLTTAYSDLNSAIEAVNSGEIFRYITKPWDIDKLNDHLINAMNLYLAREYERNLLAEKRQAMYQLAGNIAHELRTPLMSILAAAKGTDNYLPKLINAYEQAIKQHCEIELIRDAHLAMLKEALPNIEKEATHSLTAIDILLMNIKQTNVEPDAINIMSMRDCVLDAVNRYPFRETEKKMVNITGDDDFQFRGVRILMLHVLYNLIKNSLYALATDGNRGVISLCIAANKNQNRLHFKDTGPGIPGPVLPFIFESFYSTKSPEDGNNIGIGLPFCKKVLGFFGASIECFSEEGVYTEFILTFPEIQDATGRNAVNSY